MYELRSRLQRWNVTCEQLFLLQCSTGRTVTVTECALLAIAKFLVCPNDVHAGSVLFKMYRHDLITIITY